MTSPVAGWYPDPSGQPGERFWTGTGWSQQTRPTPAAQAAVPADAPQAYDGFGNPSAPVAPAAPPAPTYAGAPQPGYGNPPPFATGQYGQYGQPGQYGQRAPASKASFWSRNTLSFATIGVTLAYVLILVFAHFAILGILPLILGIRAVGRKEPLAVPAVVIGVIALILGIYEFTR